jgi:hypothetical protein
MTDQTVVRCIEGFVVYSDSCVNKLQNSFGAVQRRWYFFEPYWHLLLPYSLAKFAVLGSRDVHFFGYF